MGDEFDGSLVLGRKLSEEETRELRITLLPYFHAEGGMETDDINDFLDYTFTMLSNAKTIEYIVGEYVAFFSPEVSKKIGTVLANRIEELNRGSTLGRKETKEEEKTGVEETRPVSRKPGEGNALTMSGALGASREGGRNKKDDKKKNDEKDDKKKNNENKDETRGGKDRNRNDRREGKRGRGTERPSETFDRLAKGRDDRGRGRGRDSREDGRDRRRDERDGRGGRGNGRGPRDAAARGGGRDAPPRGSPRDAPPRGGPRDMAPRGGPRDMAPRGGPRDMAPRGGRDGGRFGRGDRDVSGHRRSRDEFEEEPDFVATGGRGGRGSGRGRGRDGPKRLRYDEGFDEGYDEGYGGYGGGHYDDGYSHYPPRRGGRGRGRVPGRGRFGRGGGSDGGEGDGNWGEGGSNEVEPTGEFGGETEGSGSHPSPMVRASFGTRGGYGGFRGRGFIRGGRGRGRFGGREQVVSMIQSKTWVRKKDGDDSGVGGGEGNATGAAES